MKEQLLFLDTNILLDFYRARNETALSLLRHVDSISNKVIMTYLVEMEFKKHRQSANLESFNALKAPSQVSRPGLFSDAASVRALSKDIKNAEKRISRLRKRLRNALLKPTSHDPVYKVAQRLFTKSDAYSLTQDNKLRFAVRHRAFRRFLLGYPPRKQGDTSIADAINWEWIVHCAEISKAEIIIVSRDSDYGVNLESEAFLNDWLVQEFRSRISQKRKINLYTRLSEALKRFQVEVTEEEQREEDGIYKLATLGISSAPLHFPHYIENLREYLSCPQETSPAQLPSSLTEGQPKDTASETAKSQ